MKILLFCCKGFEMMEFSPFVDVMGWARTDYNLDVEVVTGGYTETVNSAFNVPIKVDVVLDSINVDDYDALSIPGGFEEYGFYEEASEGLKNTAYLCCIREKGKPIALGRAIADHGYVVFIADIIVRPEYQGQGLGRKVVENLLARIKATLKPGYKIMINLLAAKGKEEFYKKFDFIDRPNDAFGCGMHQWIEGE